MSYLRRFQRDERGNIMLLGILGGGIALYWTFQAMSQIKKAIMQRENAGTIADAVASESAYWHAQGMNLLALINILMSIILSLFVIVRVSQLILITLAIAASLIPFTAGAAPALFRGAEGLYKIEQRITPPILRTLTYATQVERAIAAAFPYIALGASATPGLGSAGVQARALSGIALSPSLFPTFADRMFTRPDKKWFGQDRKTFPTRMGGLLDSNSQGATAAIAGKLTKKIANNKISVSPLDAIGSLPVEEEDYQQVCKRASMNWGRLPFLENVNVELALGWLGGNLPGLMCEPMADLKGKQALEKKLLEEVEDGASGHCTDEETKSREELRKQGKPHPEWGSVQRARCRKDKREQLEKESREKAKALAKAQPDTSKIKTARLWFFITPTEHGAAVYAGRLSIDNAFLHVWSMVTDKNDHASKAIFYPQCAAVEPSTNAWTSEATHCAENAMWRLQWRYMLGLNHSFTTELSHFAIDAARGYIGFLEGQFLSRGLGALMEKYGGKLVTGGTGAGQRVIATMMQGKNGKVNYSSWADPATAWGGPIWESLYH
jgi:hypothetical protein